MLERAIAAQERRVPLCRATPFCRANMMMRHFLCWSPKSHVEEVYAVRAMKSHCSANIAKTCCSPPR